MISNLVSKVRDNAWLFLRRAIVELISHDDSSDDGLSQENAIITTTLVQMSFELALVAYFLEIDGIYALTKDADSSLPEAELWDKYYKNELKTKSFNALKNLASDRNIFLKETDVDLVDEFQKIRNKLIHLNYEFDAGDLYDIKYDLTYFIVKVVIPVLTREEVKPSESIAGKIGRGDFKKLINFPPYAGEMHSIAKESSLYVYRCIHCDHDSLATESGIKYCYSCNEDFSLLGFIDCPYCKSKRSMIYDSLNIGMQHDRAIKGRCLQCYSDDIVYECVKCGRPVALEGDMSDERCRPERCFWLD